MNSKSVLDGKTFTAFEKALAEMQMMMSQEFTSGMRQALGESQAAEAGPQPQEEAQVGQKRSYQQALGSQEAPHVVEEVSEDSADEVELLKRQVSYAKYARDQARRDLASLQETW